MCAIYLAYLLGLALIHLEPTASTSGACCRGRESSSQIPITPNLLMERRYYTRYNTRAAKIYQLIILTYCLKILIFYHTKILRYPKTIIIIVIITMIRIILFFIFTATITSPLHKSFIHQPKKKVKISSLVKRSHFCNEKSFQKLRTHAQSVTRHYNLN